MSRDLELELEMHNGFGPWIEKHNADTEGMINDIGYSPDKYRSQRIDVGFSPSKIEAGKNANKALEELRDQYARIMGSFALARSQVSVFETAPASDEGDELLIDVVGELLDAGRSLGLLTDHAEGLFDIAKGQGGLNIALANRAKSHKRPPEHIGNFRAWVNKLMTRQFLYQQITTVRGDTVTKKVDIPDLLSVGGGVRWVIPDTENARKYLPNEKIAQTVNRGALRSFAEDKRNGKGTIEVMVPSGTQMQSKKDRDGRIEYLVAPEMSDTSANLLSHLDAVITFSVWSGRVSVGTLVEVSPDTKCKNPQKIGALAKKIRELMRQQTQRTSGIPVMFAEEIGQIAEGLTV